MSFEITEFRQKGLLITEIQNPADGSNIQIVPAAGALWHKWLVSYKRDELNLINGYADADDLNRNLKDSHKSAKLSPFACRIPQGKYTYNGKEYEFVNKFSDGSAIHGLVVGKLFRQVKADQQEKQGTVSFKYEYRHDDAGYPFDYDCTVSYTLYSDNRVKLDTLIENVSGDTIPVVDGWHPYFTTGHAVDDCLLQFYANRLVEFDARLIPTGALLPYDNFWQEKRIGGAELDHSFLLDESAPQPRCTFSDPQAGVAIRVYPSENYPVLQLYIPPDRRSIAIETLSGAPNAFNNGIGLLKLSPEEEKLFSVTFEAALG